jgi:hypothetical protein
VTLASFTALGILGAFVLPGYLTRALISRRVVLPQVTPLELLLQCTTISFALDIAVFLAWVVVACIWPVVPAPIHTMLTSLGNRHSRSVIQLGAVGVSVVVVFGLGILIGWWQNRCTDWIIRTAMTVGGPVRATPLLYFLLSDLPKKPADPEPSKPTEPIEPWVRVTTVSGHTVTGRVYQYGVYAPDAHDLVLEHARIEHPDGTEHTAEGLVHSPGPAQVIAVIAYAQGAEGKLVAPWAENPDTAAKELLKAIASDPTRPPNTQEAKPDETQG